MFQGNILGFDSRGKDDSLLFTLSRDNGFMDEKAMLYY